MSTVIYLRDNKYDESPSTRKEEKKEISRIDEELVAMTMQRMLDVQNQTRYMQKDQRPDIQKAKSVAQIKTVAGAGYNPYAPYITNPKTSMGAGTAWFIRPAQQPKHEKTCYLITCAHCVANAVPEGVTITLDHEHKNIHAEIVAVFPDIDGALIKICNDSQFVSLSDNADEYKGLELGDDTILKENDELTIYGFPLGTEEIKTIGSHYNGREGMSIQIDGGVNQGHSGAAVILKRTNKVVGFVTSGVEKASNVSYATPIGLLKPLLDHVSFFNNTEQTVKKSNVQVVRHGSLGVAVYPSYKTLNDKLLADSSAQPVYDDVHKHARQFSHHAHKDANRQKNDAAITRRSKGVIVDYVLSTSSFFGLLEPHDLIYAIATGDKNKRHNWQEINNDGTVEMHAWKGDTKYISFHELISRLPMHSTIDLLVYKFSKDKNNNVKLQEITPMFVPVNGLLDVSMPWDRAAADDYEVIAGLVIVPLSAHSKIKKLPKYIRPENLDQPALVIAKVIAPSDAAESLVDIEGVLLKVNEIPVHTIAELREAVHHLVDKKYLVFENEHNRILLLNWREVVAKESELAKNNQYPVSRIFRHVINPQ